MGCLGEVSDVGCLYFSSLSEKNLLNDRKILKTQFMRNFYPCLLAAMSLVLALNSARCEEAKATPNNYVVFVSPSLPENKKDELFKEFSYFAIGGTGKATEAEFGMKPNDTLQIFDAHSLRALLSRTFVMPASAKTPKSRFKATEEVRAAFKKFLTEKPTDDFAVDLPKLASCFKQMVDSKDARVLLIGSPLYHDDVDAHDMRQGWLSDGYFCQPLSVTAFSVAGRENSFRGNSIVFCTVSDDIYGTENKNAHMEGVKRFWGLFISQCGGKMVGYQPDINVGFSNLTKDDLGEMGPYKVDPEDKMMRVIKTKNTKKEEAPPTPVVPVVEIQAETIPDITSSEYTWLTKDAGAWNSENKGKVLNKNTKLGLTWKTSPDNGKDADLDIYVRPKGSPGELFYKNPNTPEGVHYKDFSNPDASHGFELVNLNTPIAAENLEIWVNAFGGASKNGFSGEVRILNAGRLTSYPFTIPAKQGDQGVSANKRSQSKNWIQINAASHFEAGKANAAVIPSPAKLLNAGEYTLVNGDNLYMVAEKFGVDFEELKQINGISEPRNLKSGQRIIIPQKK